MNKINQTIHRLFERQALKIPNASAVVFEQQKLTYAQLNEKSNQLARYLQRIKIIKPDTPIALFLEKDINTIIAILGTLKAGAAYVSIDPKYPDQRVKYILDDTKAGIVLTQTKLTERLNKISNAQFLNMDGNLYQKEKSDNLKSKINSSDLAYIIYTSGTTGNPKGVMIEHKQFSSFLLNFAEQSFIKELNNINVLSLTSYVFDIFGLEYGLPLLFGGCVYLSDFNNINKDYLKKVSIIQQTPNVMNAVCDQYPDLFKSKLCLVGGEKLNKKIADKLVNNFKKVVNVYGPAECTVWSSSYVLESKSPKYTLIGKPLFNENFYILDKNKNTIPIGEIGELYIGGIGIARGYLNKPDLTKEKFIANPFLTKADNNRNYGELYKTGDLCRVTADGNIEYIGRNDFQVKIRGHRIELGEIENVLISLDNIQQACVKVYEKNNNKYIAGYYISDINLNEKEIQQKIAKQLPDYMVPGVLIRMKHFPLTINGKLDKKALPEPNFKNKVSYTAPRTSLEKKLCNIWQEVLKLKRIGITDDFFNIGGNSILSINLVYKMNSVLSENNTKLSITDLFKHKTIKNLLSNFKSSETQIKTLAVSKNKNNKMFFIHPGGAGCEVYTGLANKIKDRYNCYGIDNYNILNKDNIRSLNLLAEKYINNLVDFGLDSEINLCGWSLGGKIALEMGYLLEKKGYKNINIFLLDTVMLDDNLQTMFKRAFDDSYNDKIKNNLANEGYNKKYIKKIITAMKSEDSISKQVISDSLRYAKVTLFKAIQEDRRINYKGRAEINKYIQSLKHNNAEKFAKNIKTVVLECHHGNIIDYLISNGNQLLS